MPNALRIGLLGPLQIRDEAGSRVSVEGRQPRVLFTILALNAGRVVTSASMAGQIWPGDPPAYPGTVAEVGSRLRAELRLVGPEAACMTCQESALGKGPSACVVGSYLRRLANDLRHTAGLESCPARSINIFNSARVAQMLITLCSSVWRS